MRLQNNLLNFLPRRQPGLFYAGQWLATLEDRDLHEITELASKADSGSQDAMDEIVAICVTLVAGEQGTREISFDPALISGVGMFASFEKFSRSKMVVLRKPLTLTGEMAFELTEEGKMLYDQILAEKTFH